MRCWGNPSPSSLGSFSLPFERGLERYADSIVKLYAVSAAMALTAFLSAIFLNYAVQLHAVGGYLVTVLSMCGASTGLKGAA